MFGQAKDKEQNPSSQTSAPRKSTGNAEGSNSSHSVIAQGTIIEGTFKSSGMVRFDGKIVGDLDCKDKIVIGESGHIEGNILAGEVVVKGKIAGVIKSSGLLQLLQSARVDGSLFSKKVQIEEGAQFNGECRMEKS